MARCFNFQSIINGFFTVTTAIAALSFLSSSSSSPSTVFVQGLPSGAGGCAGGQPAVGGTHIISPSSGSLEDGNITVSIGGNILQTGQTIFMKADGETSTSVSVSGGPAGVFKGVLVRFEVSVSGSDDFFEDFSTVDGNIKDAGETCLNTFTSLVFGYTHSNPNDKESVEGTYTLLFEDDVTGTLDVTVVIQNSGGVSAFYYSGYQIAFDTSTPSPTVAPSSLSADTPANGPTESPSAPSSGVPSFLSAVTKIIATALVGFAVVMV
jgi:hypothetical protein